MITSARILWTAFVFFFLFHAELFGQRSTDTLFLFQLKPQQRTFETSFGKQLTMYSLSSNLVYAVHGKDLSFSIKNDYRSTLIKSSEKNVRDEDFFSLQTGYRITPQWQAGILLSGSFFSDSRKIEINDASSAFAAVYTNYKILRNAYTAPFAGITSNKQVGESDQGFWYGIEGAIEQEEYGGMLISALVRFKNEDISPRKNLFRDLRASALSIIEGGMLNTFSFSFTETGRDFYYKADSITASAFSITNNLQRRTERTYLLSDMFTYDSFLENTSVTLSGSFLKRLIERDIRFKVIDIPSAASFDTEIDETKYEIESDIEYHDRLLGGLIKIAYTERDERHRVLDPGQTQQIFYNDRSELEAQKNNLSHRILLSGQAGYRFSDNDLLSLSVSHIKLQYDTPSIFNYDDRDELLSIIRLRYTRKINPYFEAFAALEGNLRKTVYILSQRSSNNNTNRVLKFTAGGQYRGMRFSTYNSFDISANYTVYTYEDIVPNYRSYSIRQIAYFDSSKYSFTETSAIRFLGSYKLTEQGDLNWENFSINPSREVDELIISVSAVKTLSNFEASFGFRYFLLDTYAVKKGMRSRQSYYHSAGPIVGVTYDFRNHLLFTLSGRYEFVSATERDNYALTTFQFGIHWQF